MAHPSEITSPSCYKMSVDILQGKTGGKRPNFTESDVTVDVFIRIDPSKKPRIRIHGGCLPIVSPCDVSRTDDFSSVMMNGLK